MAAFTNTRTHTKKANIHTHMLAHAYGDKGKWWEVFVELSNL